MCNEQSHTDLFKKSQEVTLGDGHTLEAIGQGVVTLKMTLSNEKTKRCHLHNVLCVPQLAYNLLSVTKASEAGKSVLFYGNVCRIYNKRGKVIAVANKQGSLYVLLELQTLSTPATECHIQSKQRKALALSLWAPW